jgi:hypothetical protein
MANQTPPSRSSELFELAGVESYPDCRQTKWQLSAFSAAKTGRNKTEDSLAVIRSLSQITIGIFDGRSVSGDWSRKFTSMTGLTPGQFASSTCAQLLRDVPFQEDLREQIEVIHLAYRQILSDLRFLSPDCVCLPATSCCIVRVDSMNDTISIAQLGDSAVILERIDASLLYLESVAHASYDRRIKKLTFNGTSDETSLDHQYRKYCNSPNALGVSCFNGANNVPLYNEIFHTDLRNIKSILVFSDGLLNLASDSNTASDLMTRAIDVIAQNDHSASNFLDDTTFTLLRRE